MTWIVDLLPDVVPEREWEDVDGNLFRVAKPGWSFVARRSPHFALEVGTADTYEEALHLARELISTREEREAR